MKTKHEQNDKFNKETEITRKSETEILELKNTTNGTGNAMESINIRMAQAKERIYRLDDRNLDIIQAEGNKEKSMKKKQRKPM